MNAKVKITGFISGGLMGSDPWSPSAFSGSSKSLFQAIEAEGALARAFGLSISKAAFALKAAPRYHPDKEVWRRRVYQSRNYRAALTEVLRRRVAPEDAGTVVLQVGAYADGPAVYAGVAPVVTYQDSLAAEYWSSPYAPEAIRRDENLKRQHWGFEIAVARGAAKVLTNSEHTRRSYIDNYGLAPEQVINVGIGYNAASPTTLPVKDYAAPEIVFIGKEFHRKGGDLLIEAFAEVRRQVPNARLHIVGPVTAPPELAGANGVTFHGFLSRNDAAQSALFYDLLRRACLCVLPSRYEPTGLATLEAMSWGAPAVVTRNWAFVENVDHGKTGFLLPELTPAAIAAAVIDALSDRDRLARMSAEAFATVPARFAWSGVAQRIIAVCAEVSTERRRASGEKLDSPVFR